MPNSNQVNDEQIVDIPVIDFAQIPDYPGKNFLSPETIVMFAGMFVTYMSLKHGWNLPAISEQVQQVDGQVITKVNQYHQLILAVILAVLNGGTFAYAKGKTDERRSYYRVVERGIGLKDRAMAVRQLTLEREIIRERRMEASSVPPVSTASAITETDPKFQSIPPKRADLL
jgi:hypothetical protein